MRLTVSSRCPQFRSFINTFYVQDFSSTHSGEHKGKVIMQSRGIHR
jgi:hypothetical protein